MVLREGTPHEAGLRADRLELIRKRAQEWVDADIHPALVLLVARHGVIALHDAFGRYGPEPDAEPLTTDAIFPLMSQTKPITAFAIMILAEDGLLGLTRPVQEYLPEFTGEGKDAVRVDHLLTHTSGIADMPVDYFVAVKHLLPHLIAALQDHAPENQHPWDRACLQIAYGWPLSEQPGTKNMYAQINYVLLGEIVRRVSGCSFAEFTQSRIFGPLGIQDTSTGLPEEKELRLVRRSFEEMPEMAALFSEVHRQPPGRAGNSGVHSTAYDTAVFLQMLLNGGSYGTERILSRRSVDLMTTNQIPGIPADSLGENHREGSFGFGWAVAGAEPWSHQPLLPRGAFSHGGVGWVFPWADPSTGTIAVFFSVAPHVTGRGPTDVRHTADLFGTLVMAAAED